MNVKILVSGPRDSSPYNNFFILSEFKKIIDKIKSDNQDIYIYTGLQEGVELNVTKFCFENNIKVIGCIPYRNFESKFNPRNQQIYKYLLPRIFKLHVISKTYSYKAYKLRTDYMINHCNSAVSILKGEGHTKMLLDRLARSWRNQKNPIYIINFKDNKTTLVNT